MRKLMVIAIMQIVALAASAQNDDLKNEIGVYYGFDSASDIIGMYTHIFTFSSDDQHDFWGPIGVEYYYHTTRVVAFGAVASIAGCSWGKGNEDYSSKYITLMPSVKFNWLRKNYFGMYSALSAGAMYLSHNLKDEYVKDDTSKIWFMWQITPIGMEFGGKAFRGFAEAGVGEKGLLCAGLRYKF